MTQSPLSDRMSSGELHAAVSLAIIFFLRMLGLFLLLPVFSPQAIDLEDATLKLVGIAAGAYGLTQALLQIPFGTLSDRFGRKPTITVGLLVFGLGSAVAALSNSIYGVIIGRALQGAGAISAAIMALAADLTREEHRTKAMALIGMSIGLAFALAFVLAPAVNQWRGLHGVFWTSAALALCALVILHWRIPTPSQSHHHRECEADARDIGAIVRDPELLRLNAGIFFLHMILIASFIAIPLALREEVGLPLEHHWYIYLPVLVLSVALMLPFVRRADKHGGRRPYFLLAVIALGVSQLGLWLGYKSLIELFLALLLFFTAFNFLEASLPALVSKAAPADRRGTALGIYSTSQFLGTFIGGICGGWLSHSYGLASVFLFCAVTTVAWWALAVGMREPEPVVVYLLRLGALNGRTVNEVTARLLEVSGVKEAVVIAEEGIAYLKVNPSLLDRRSLEAIANAPS